MNRKQLTALFVSHTIPYVVGNALLPLLPVYVQQLGGEPTVTGFYLGLAFAALAFGSLITGWLSGRFQRRKAMIILAAAINFPTIFLMGQVSSIELLSLLTALVWFNGGVATASVNILTGMYADPAQRGRTFGIIGLTLGLSALIGGLIGGPVVDRWGFEALFTIIALIQLVQIGAGSMLEDRRQVVARQAGNQPLPIIPAFWLLAGASVLTYVVQFSAGLGRPLVMSQLGLDATAISSTAAISGLITLPLPFLTGRLSDRMGRRLLLVVGYAAVALGTLLLAFAGSLWQFWLSTALFAVVGTTVSVGSALVLDVVPPEAADVALARFAATPWIGGVIGFVGAGFVIQALGFQWAFALQAALPLLSIVLILSITHGARQGLLATTRSA